MDEETGEGSLILDHVIHAMPPIEYNLDGTVKHTYAYGKPNDIDSRFRCFSNEKLGAHGVVGLDLSAANEFCGSEVQYAAKAKSSHLHNTLHEDQSKHGVVVAIPDGWSPAELVRSLWPNCEEMMTASMLFNDGRVEALSVSGVDPTAAASSNLRRRACSQMLKASRKAGRVECPQRKEPQAKGLAASRELQWGLVGCGTLIPQGGQSALPC